MGTGNSGMAVLSIGFTRALWEEGGSDDTRPRMLAYAENLSEYVVIANSYRHHGLSEKRIGRLRAIPTDALTPVDSFFRMVILGISALRGMKVRATLIQAQDPIFTGAAAVLLGRIFQIPVNVCVYGPNVFDRHWIGCSLANRLTAPLGRWVLRRAQGIQVDGSMTGRILQHALHGKAIHLKPMIPTNLDRFLALPLARPDGGPFRILFVGRLECQKNLPMLSRVFRRLAGRAAAVGRSIVLEVVGGGSEERSFRRSLADLPEGASVDWQGTIPHSEVPGRFAASHALFLTSFFEGYPRVLMEAAAAGLPVVTTAVSGSDEAVVDGVSGSIVPVGDEDMFLEHAAALLENPGLRDRMSGAARNHAQGGLSRGPNLERQIEIWESFRISTPRAGSAWVGTLQR